MARLASAARPNAVVVKNGTLGQIKWEQMVFLGNPEYGCDLHPIDFALFAEACGGNGITIEDPAQCGAALDAALAAPGRSLCRGSWIPSSRRCPPRSRSSSWRILRSR